ncbi:metallophosphoesterase [Thiovibrio frasassiensis]|uniref:Metallophosphoesterase n=1 Tax=Thiovibrio frasassiensis TaxID=2984131 RepID=A0A9X4MIM2_9BACT|nr:metallophosphoesterase [Thiovibrio frasassiensis]MDG4477048.1 metallophosphoesterase [Thiovibrio frasassiensis]
MIRFLLVYLSIYPLVHYYAFRKIKKAFPLGRIATLCISLFMATMIAAPIMVRLAERAGIETGARFWAYASFSWMGLLFLFISLAAALDLITLAIQAGEKMLKRKLCQTPISPRQVLALQAILVFALYSYGLFEAGDIRLEHLEIVSPKISASTGRIRIAQISDVHLGLIIREARLKRIIARMEEARPDILVATGDLVDGQLNHLTTETSLLGAVKPRLGKFAITGNHEFYAGLQDALAFTKAAGFTMLRHQGMVIGTINFVGVDDPAVKSIGKEHAASEHELLAAMPKENFTVLLKHRPDIAPESLGLFDLQLSGHTHKGQIFPFNLLTWFFYPQRGGRVTQLNSGLLYLSRGTGTWGPPIRFLAPPEVTIIDLVPGK